MCSPTHRHPSAMLLCPPLLRARSPLSSTIAGSSSASSALPPDSGPDYLLTINHDDDLAQRPLPASVSMLKDGLMLDGPGASIGCLFITPFKDELGYHFEARSIVLLPWTPNSQISGATSELGIEGRLQCPGYSNFKRDRNYACSALTNKQVRSRASSLSGTVTMLAAIRLRGQLALKFKSRMFAYQVNKFYQAVERATALQVCSNLVHISSVRGETIDTLKICGPILRPSKPSGLHSVGSVEFLSIWSSSDSSVGSVEVPSIRSSRLKWSNRSLRGFGSKAIALEPQSSLRAFILQFAFVNLHLEVLEHRSAISGIVSVGPNRSPRCFKMLLGKDGTSNSSPDSLRSTPLHSLPLVARADSLDVRPSPTARDIGPHPGKGAAPRRAWEAFWRPGR
ncbi:hypothetical protein B0H15DRAFT_797280 [Mycena belliarum]|uniref:Uncharacterized protein n=1 Tax=Mycena belliarum TaxID=1033014 RepID=A0AAD6UDM3_9AGAR|nr:hypothetical protein B0H15DRAFT_797278 [Mycena belliae]KAJ7098578.1 hypothetical protein B0H15DRAFT_797280 [Mycena belliae]